MLIILQSHIISVIDSPHSKITVLIWILFQLLSTNVLPRYTVTMTVSPVVFQKSGQLYMVSHYHIRTPLCVPVINANNSSMSHNMCVIESPHSKITVLIWILFQLLSTDVLPR